MIKCYVQIRKKSQTYCSSFLLYAIFNVNYTPLFMAYFAMIVILEKKIEISYIYQCVFVYGSKLIQHVNLVIDFAKGKVMGFFP